MTRRGVAWAVIGLALAVWLCLRRGEYGRLPQRAVIGLLLGALAGALNGTIWAGLVLVPDTGVSAETVDLVAIAAVATTGAVLGATIGGLWTPRRVAVGLLAGVLGAVLVQAGRNTLGNPSAVYALGLNCLVIVGVVLLAMLTLDVRAAGARRAEAAPHAVGA
jgi:drug/metabolite transporter (DMT)-like permease